MKCLEGSVEVSGEIPLEAAADLFGRAPFGTASFDVGAGVRVVSHARDDGHVQGPVEPPVTTAVESMTGGVTRRGWDRVDSRQSSEGGFGADSAGVRPGGQNDRDGVLSFLGDFAAWTPLQLYLLGLTVPMAVLVVGWVIVAFGWFWGRRGLP